jgi:hypothetical protein
VRRVLLATAALVAAVAVFTVVSLPPARVALDTTWSDGSVPGILHVHTSRSDGRSSPDDIAAAAARAGLKFLVFTDHGDGTRPPDPPTYRSGVLCLDGVEISTSGGHYVAIGLEQSPYPLAGEPRDVVEDVRRMGGFGIAAHPDSPKAELQWTDWATRPDALEIVNPDTGWRTHLYEGGWRSRLQILQSLVAYPWRSSGTIASLLTGSQDALAEWDRETARQPMVGVAGVDAHAKLALLAADPGDNRFSLPLPGYEASFRTLSVRVFPDAQMSGSDAARDASLVLSALRRGRAYVAIDAWASPPALSFTATNSSGTAGMGETLAPGGPITLRVKSQAPEGFAVQILRDGTPLGAPRAERDLTLETTETTGTYRVELRAPGRDGQAAWVFSNPIYVRTAEAAPASTASGQATATASLFDGRTATGWSTEADPSSLAAVEAARMISGTELRIRFGLSGGSDVGQFAGAAVSTPEGVADSDAVAFTVRAERPMRISIQVRAHVDNAPPERWQRAVYVDEMDRTITVPFADMTPVGATHTPRAPLANVRHVMFIVNTPHTAPGASGRLWFKSVRLEKY